MSVTERLVRCIQMSDDSQQSSKRRSQPIRVLRQASDSSKSEASPTQGMKAGIKKNIYIIIKWNLCLGFRLAKQNILLCTKQCCRCYLLQGAVALGIPLLGVQTDDDPLAQEEGRPHDYIPDGAFPLVMQNEVEHYYERVNN